MQKWMRLAHAMATWPLTRRRDSGIPGLRMDDGWTHHIIMNYCNLHLGAVGVSYRETRLKQGFPGEARFTMRMEGVGTEALE